jgi:hypothetical protein
VQADFQQLEQVILNLLINAERATREKAEGRVRVATRYLAESGCVAVEVEDDGVGMGPELAQQIFEPFFTTRRDEGGTGLGLSVSYDLVRAHQGTLGVLSRPGIGSRFTVFLPTEASAKRDLRPAILFLTDGDGIDGFDPADLGRVYRPMFSDVRNPGVVLVYLQEQPEIDTVLIGDDAKGFDWRPTIEAINESFPLISVVVCAETLQRNYFRSYANSYHYCVVRRPRIRDKIHKFMRVVGRQVL